MFLFFLGRFGVVGGGLGGCLEEVLGVFGKLGLEEVFGTCLGRVSDNLRGGCLEGC